jgi:hypothetical protein
VIGGQPRQIVLTIYKPLIQTPVLQKKKKKKSNGTVKIVETPGGRLNAFCVMS